MTLRTLCSILDTFNPDFFCTKCLLQIQPDIPPKTWDLKQKSMKKIKPYKLFTLKEGCGFQKN